MIPRLILSISEEGNLEVFLQGEGEARQNLLGAYEKTIKHQIPEVKIRLNESLKGVLNQRPMRGET